ncbi:MAG: hypothetical protein ACREJO_12160, partial [Phycisphaerales bacterium]
FESDGAGGLRLTQGDPIEDVVSPGVPARVAKGLSPFLLDAYSPVATQMDIDMGITVTPRKTIGVGEGDIPDVGYLAPRITDRKVSASFDPEQPPLATFNFTRRMINASLHKFQVEAGRVGDTQGIVGIIGPTVQLNGDATAGDRDGIVIRNPSLDFVGTQDDEIIVYHIF